jgi:hypothetical protein
MSSGYSAVSELKLDSWRVWFFDTSYVGELNERAAERSENGPLGELRILDPLVDENARLVNQNGVFTRSPVGTTVDDWIREAAGGEVELAMIKIVIPGDDREDCLRHLNQMNINHVTLFPDLDGATRYCNHQLLIWKY